MVRIVEPPDLHRREAEQFRQYGICVLAQKRGGRQRLALEGPEIKR